MVPKVSVVMSVLNGAEFLRPAIDSILGQNFADLELVVIDNASTDGTPEILDSYADARLIRLRNDSVLTLTQSLNKGLAAARGYYVARLDADDIALPERIGRQVAFLDAHPYIALLATGWNDLMPDGCLAPGPAVPVSHDAIAAALAWCNPLVHSSLMYRRDVVQALGGYPADFAFAQDMALYLRLLERHRLAALPERLVQIRQHAQQFSARPTLSLLRAAEVERLLALSNRRPLPPDIRRRGRRALAAARVQMARAMGRARPLAAMGWLMWAFATDPTSCVAEGYRRLCRHSAPGGAA